ncbi:hypothetical protein BG000_002452 [Podila horticola]|nr:hypothetical protein BG000_002452 [Podila horticola]
MTSVHLLETLLYDPTDGLFLLDYHCDRMIESAKELAPFFCNDPETFLRDLIPTRSELTNKLDVAVKNAGKDQRQRLRLLLDFDGAVTIQSSHLPCETKAFQDGSIVVVLDTEATPKDNVFLHHKTTEREVYNEARNRADIPFDVILYNEDKEVMETTIANIAVETENEETGELEWITPRASTGLLRGTMRRKLLESGEIREGVVTLNDLKKAVMDNRRIKCFNSVRKEYFVTLK